MTKRTNSSEDCTDVTLKMMQEVFVPTDVDELSEAHRGRSAARRLMWLNLQQLVSMSHVSAKKFWKFFRDRVDPKQRHLAVSLEQLRTTFEARMNPPPTLPKEFDHPLFWADEQCLRSMPESTTDQTTEKFFSRAFTESDIDWAKLRIQSHTNSARGIDGVQYSKLLEIPSQSLADLFNLCISTCDAPRAWLTTMLVGILKHGRPANSADSYRLIALECCLLKMLTLLIAQRFREWIATKDILPEAQNGFREGFRTNNCPFILRCAVDQCRVNGSSLLALFIDLENAFPSTNLPTLWKKLAEVGAKGPLMDWMRMLYDRMRYTVATQGRSREFSGIFRSLWGILAGDSFSPDLFTYFVADCKPPRCWNDIMLAEVVIACLLLADDMLFMEILAPGAMEEKLEYMVNVWCRQNFLKLNVNKTKGMIFGPLPKKMPCLFVGEEVIEIVTAFKYVGLYFQSTHRFIFALHYEVKAKEAMKNIYRLTTIESSTGDLWPQGTLRVFMARVDPHLVNGCEVAIDVHRPSLKLLEDAQVFGLRRILRLSAWSMRVVLFTETGIMPVRYRRIILAIRYLRYLLGIPNSRYAYAALQDSIRLYRGGKPGWVSDIDFVLRNLPVPVKLSPDEVLTATGVDSLLQRIEESCAKWLYDELEGCTRLPLLHSRTEVGQVPSLKNMLRLRSYLVGIVIPSHRRAVTRLLCSEHCLAVEQLRRTERRRPAVPRELRLCRFCHQEIEDEPHALLYCMLCPQELLERRYHLIQEAKRLVPGRSWTLGHPDLYQNVRDFLRFDVLLPEFGCYVYNVLKVFKATDMYLHPSIPLTD